jgi:viroplasmin and RNaseH domain-containing protein
MIVVESIYYITGKVIATVHKNMKEVPKNVSGNTYDKYFDKFDTIEEAESFAEESRMENFLR